ncbi:MAG: hypothetical protein R2865_03695 [Deinococcales bacterium]
MSLSNTHNLFGKVSEAHVKIEQDGFKLERFVKGQKARRVIENMGYDAWQLHEDLSKVIDSSQSARGKLTESERQTLLGLYNAELVGYTYLEQMS